jgi:hypothetical protein
VNAFPRAIRSWFAVAAAVFAAAAVGGTASAQPAGELPAQFGSPPSGDVPILFNDHHIYAKPDQLKQSRVLAAIVKNGTVLVPLRSLFEQTGATVSFDGSTKTVDVAKPGADVKVTVGKPWVVVNGEERPLDVPPEIDNGFVFVPLRVLSEGMGAYVQWVPEKRLVVIRYVEAQVAPPPPPPAPSPVPIVTPPPLPSAPPPAPAPKVTPVNEKFLVADYLISPKVYNELSPGNTAHSSYKVSGAVEIPAFGENWALSASYRHVLYPHYSNFATSGCTPGSAGCGTFTGGAFESGACPSNDQGCVTTVGAGNVEGVNGLGQIYVAAFNAAENDLDVHFGIRVFNPRFYVGLAGLFKNYNYLGYPNLAGIGFGVEKLPDLDEPFSLYGSAYYYPNVAGKYTYPSTPYLGALSGSQITLSYSVWKYDLGGSYNLGNTGAFLDLGYGGEHATGKQNAPSNTSVNAPYAGVGLHF